MNPMPYEIVLGDFGQPWVLGRHLEQKVTGLRAQIIEINNSWVRRIKARPRPSQARQRPPRRAPVARTRPARRSRLRKTTKAAV